MNTGSDDFGYRQQISEVLRLRFEEKLSIHGISQRVSVSHSTVHIIIQRFAKSGHFYIGTNTYALIDPLHVFYCRHCGRRDLARKHRVRIEGSWEKVRHHTAHITVCYLGLRVNA